MKKPAYRYLVVFEREGKSYGAFVPDLPGCVATGKDLATVKRRIRTAIAMHVEDMLARGQRLPKPATQSEYVDAVVPAA
jgi:predicted RNase H-like HicB family nuclease